MNTDQNDHQNKVDLLNLAGMLGTAGEHNRSCGLQPLHAEVMLYPFVFLKSPKASAHGS